MFSSKGLFSEIACPHPDTCLLPKCIFKHPNSKSVANPEPGTQSHVDLQDNTQDGQRKRIKLDETPTPDVKSEKQLVGITLADVLSRKTIKSDDKPTKKRSSETKSISPPPLRRKIQDGTSLAMATPKQSTSAFNPSTTSSVSNTPVKSLAKAPLKEEGLNPRALKAPPPASHDMRFRLLRALHDQFKRLNSDVKKRTDDTEKELILSDQALITRALDLEEEATASPLIYSNKVKNHILSYKRMGVEQWIEERKKEIESLKTKAAPETPIKTPTGPKLVTSGLSIQDELTLLHKLYTPITKLSAHGYVSSIPTEEQIKTTNAGLEAAKGWEVCDRCKSRFQVFPSRRLEDGALTTGGRCTYHYGKPYFTDRSALDPKAKRVKKYRCCNEAVGDSAGCTQSETHVFKISEVKRLAAISNFKETPQNLERLSDRPVCIDGEMGYTVYGLELIRLTATSWPEGEELFDVLVRPFGPILDLNSRYSGVYPRHLAEASPYTPPPKTRNSQPESKSTSLQIVSSPSAARQLLFTFLSPTTPLIGHGLENDLNALRLIHPTIIDTALLFPHKAGLPYRNGLKALMKQYLGKDVQVASITHATTPSNSTGESKAAAQTGKEEEPELSGHDSKEDANSAGELVRYKLGETWHKMLREGWAVKDGVFRPPLAREGGLILEGFGGRRGSVGRRGSGGEIGEGRGSGGIAGNEDRNESSSNTPNNNNNNGTDNDKTIERNPANSITNTKSHTPTPARRILSSSSSGGRKRGREERGEEKELNY